MRILGLSFLPALTLIFVIAKLTGFIAWPVAGVSVSGVPRDRDLSLRDRGDGKNLSGEMSAADSTTGPRYVRMLARMREAIESARKRGYWLFVDRTMAGKRTPSKESVAAEPVASGTVLNATDRSYVVMPNGSWKNNGKHAEPIPAHRSHIRLLPKPDRNKYNRYTPLESKP